MSRLHEERGANAVMVALLLVVLLGMLSLSVDGGFLYLKFRGMRNANDAAALAAALSCAKGEGQVEADAQADLLATRNVSDANDDLAPPVYDPSCDAPAGKVTVHYEGEQKLFFSQVVGVSSPKPVGATATASWGLAGGAARVAPLMLSMDRLSDCDIPYGENLVIHETWCSFWWDNDPDNLGNAAWGLMNLDQWNVLPTDQCSNAGQSSYASWLEFGFPGTLLMNPYPEPTYACRDSGFFGGALDNAIETAIATGEPYAFPVNDPSQQIDSDGNLCPSPGCTPDKYYIVGFAWLKLIGIYRWQDPEFATYCGGFPATANSRCLVAQWEGFTTSSILGGGATFGNMIAVTLSG